MKKRYLATLALAVTSLAQASTFKVTISNGSAMGISPGVLYTTRNTDSDRAVGSIATDGFTQLCQNGNAEARGQELSKLKNVPTHLITEGIAPGETKTFMIDVSLYRKDKLHFETMYGRSKDICGVFSVDHRSLRAPLEGRDDVVRTGRFSAPYLPQDTGDLCRDGSATACLRSLSSNLNPVRPVEFFRPYLPSVLGFLTERFGSEEVDTLLIPTGGAIRFTIQRH